MFVVAVTIFVKPENRQSFIDATLDNARNTRREPGNVRFDVLNAEDDPNRFLLYEAYREKDDFSKHQQTEHYLRWKQAVTDWMAQPRQGVKHTAIFFGDGVIMEPTALNRTAQDLIRLFCFLSTLLGRTAYFAALWLDV